MSKKVHWVHWIDPFKQMIEKIENENKFKEELNEYEEGHFENGEMTINSLSPMDFMMPMMIQHRAENAKFIDPDMWIGHTNFEITKNSIQKICSVPGVDIAERISRYQFRIIIGKLWENASEFRKVRVGIENKLCGLHNELTHDLEVVDQYNAEIKGKLKAKVARIRNKLSKKYKYWAILVLPNGVVNSIGDDVLSDDFTNKISIYNLSILHVGGILQSYLDNKK